MIYCIKQRQSINRQFTYYDFASATNDYSVQKDHAQEILIIYSKKIVLPKQKFTNAKWNNLEAGHLAHINSKLKRN